MSYFVLTRPGQWIKNILVFAPIFFIGRAGNYEDMRAVFFTFLVFTLFSVAAYIINDIIDRDDDALHPVKRFRPIASGVISPARAAVFAAVIFSCAVWIMMRFIPSIMHSMVAYAFLTAFYTFYLKRIPLVDIVTVTSFYLLRVAAGGSAIHIIPSRWLVACVMFLALFIVLGKRRAECAHSASAIRPALTLYASEPYGMREMLDHLLPVAAAATISSYGAYTILAVHSDLAVYSLFFVIFGIFRYFFLIYRSAFAESAEIALTKDMPLLFSVCGWGIFMYIVVYHL